MNSFHKLRWPEEVVSAVGIRITSHPDRDTAVRQTPGNPWITEIKDASHAVLDKHTSLIILWKGEYVRIRNTLPSLVNIIFPEAGIMWFVSDKKCEPAVHAEASAIGSQKSRFTIGDQANKIIYGDREQTYGSPDKNLKVIASLWTVYLNARPSGTDLTINDVCAMMRLLKEARLINSPEHEDSMVDSIGYMLLQERCQRIAKGKE